MSDLRELYQELILDHHKRPRNCHALADADCDLEGYNPLCGDKLHLYVKMDGDKVADIGFEGSGCAISVASASLMTEAVKGRTVEQAQNLINNFRDMITGNSSADPSTLGKTAVLAGVREFPTRVKCATLAWHTLRAALDGQHEPVSTE